MKRICGGLTIAGRFLNPLLMLPSLQVARNSQAVFIKMSGDPITYGEVPHRSFYDCFGGSIVKPYGSLLDKI